ncbi:MAG: tryptophan 7-halogenase [Burkholderiaceae bacterium]|nr:tryptophan 7-halogenase [Burkholderiaceae bacterium]
MRNFVVIGGGTAGWFAALELRRLFGQPASITVIESPRTRVMSIGEGGILIVPQALKRYGISEDDFMKATGAAYKLGFQYIGWNTGREDDVYYHLFHRVPEADIVNGIPVNWAMLAANGVGVHYAIDSLPLILRNAAQEEIRAARAKAGADHFPASFHFDVQRVAAYLKQVAMARGVRLLEANVNHLERDGESGFVRGIRIDGQEAALPVDFLIDASGFSRIALGKTYNEPMRSYTKYLRHDRALTFYIPPTSKNPHLVTRALAMDAGWMFQIPVHDAQGQERISCGYIHSSAHLSADAAHAEIEKRLGCKIDPLPMMHFDAKHFERVWVGNVMAVGLASGFIEPLESASIGQMLGQMMTFGELVGRSAYIVPELAINTFNQRNQIDWHGIADYLCLRYDVKRRDTPFWRDVATQVFPATYVSLKNCWQYRLPRPIDMATHAIGNLPHFPSTSWMAAGQGTGVVPMQAAAADLASLPSERMLEANKFLASVRSRFGLGTPA